MRDHRGRYLRHYFYGGAELTLERIVTRAAALVGANAVVGAFSPPLRPAGAPEDEAVLERIAEARARLPAATTVHLGDAAGFEPLDASDLVLAFTVFSSILDETFQHRLAN